MYIYICTYLYTYDNTNIHYVYTYLDFHQQENGQNF